MEARKALNDKLVAWIINKVKTEYADDVSLVLIYGSHVNGTANSRSDVDCYYIPKTERGYDLATGFIIAGVGYDIFPMSWERVKGIADLQECLTPLVGDVQIIYCNSEEDLARFQGLQERLKKNLANREYTEEIAVARWEEAEEMCIEMQASYEACEMCAGMKSGQEVDEMCATKESVQELAPRCATKKPGHPVAEVRMLAGAVIMKLADAVAVKNHDYYHFGLKRQFEDLQSKFPDVPREIVEDYRGVVEAGCIADVKGCAEKMLNDVREYLQIPRGMVEKELQQKLQKELQEKDLQQGEQQAAPWQREQQDAPQQQAIQQTGQDASITPAVRASVLAELYEEIVSTFNKIYVCCENGNYILAFLSAVCLQWELDDVRELGCPEYDLLGAFYHKELDKLAERTRRIEDDFVRVISENGGVIKKYDSFEEFEAAGL